MQKLSQQAVLEASEHREEVVKDLMITHSKVRQTNMTFLTIYSRASILLYYFNFSVLLSDCDLSSGGNMCISLERKSSTRVAPL